MSKDVIITIRGLQQLEDSPQEAVELLTPGLYDATEGGGWRITYRESELTGMGDTTTTVDVNPREVVLTRQGAVNSKMIFREGKRHLSVYDTDYGSMMVGVGVSSIRNTLGERGGQIEIKYSVDIDRVVSGKNAFTICVKEARS